MIRPRYWEVKPIDEMFDPNVVREMYEKGNTQKYICETLNCTAHQLKWIRKKYNIQRRVLPFNTIEEYIQRREVEKFEEQAKESLKPFIEIVKKEQAIIAKRSNSIRNRRYKEAIKGLSRKEMKKIQEFYLECPEGYEVDHIIPLAKGGLHRIKNLQYLTKEENLKKGAKILPEHEEIFFKEYLANKIIEKC